MDFPREISVVLPVRDAEKTLRDAVLSLTAQSLPAREILLILNGCRDQTTEIAETLARQQGTIRILQTPAEGGVALAAQRGCEVASSPLIARMDADDLAHHERFAHQCATLQETGADLVTSRIRSLNSLGAGMERFVDWANTLRQPEDFLRERFVESPVVQPGVLMKREAYLAAGGYQLRKGPEDYDLWLRMLAQGCRFYQSEKALLDWRDSPTRLTRSHADYSEDEMARTKGSYLAQLPRVRKNGVVLAGSGPIGRRLGKILLEEQVAVHGFFEVAPRKIGSTVKGRPVWGPKDFGVIRREAVLLACVGRGGREEVRALAEQAGYREGDDFFACC